MWGNYRPFWASCITRSDEYYHTVGELLTTLTVAKLVRKPGIYIYKVGGGWVSVGLYAKVGGDLQLHGSLLDPALIIP